jgi:phosphoglycolate phosphatase-like HAD superfamily hydrolase
MARRKTIVFDFDGVINSYKSGFIRPTVITDPPVEGIKEEIDRIREKYRVVVVSTRCAYDGGVEAIEKYLAKHNIVVDKVQAEKPPAYAYVDDRAINFDGKSAGLFEKIEGFKNWLDAEKEAAKTEK